MTFSTSPGVGLLVPDCHLAEKRWIITASLYLKAISLELNQQRPTGFSDPTEGEVQWTCTGRAHSDLAAIQVTQGVWIEAFWDVGIASWDSTLALWWPMVTASVCLLFWQLLGATELQRSIVGDFSILCLINRAPPQVQGANADLFRSKFASYVGMQWLW